MFVILWEFEVKPGCEQSFESAYGPEGAWTQLFRRDSGFLKTLPLKDPSLECTLPSIFGTPKALSSPSRVPTAKLI
jgi:hypothetical protein